MPLIAKVLGCLAIYLALLGLIFAIFVKWQLGLGLNSLLSGSAGERLKDFGESIHEELEELRPEEWDRVLRPLAAEKGLKAEFLKMRATSEFVLRLPANVLEQARQIQPLPRGFRGLRRPSPPPLPRSDDLGIGGKPRKRVLSRPVFLLRGDGGDGYWAGVQIFFNGATGQPPRAELLLIRSESLSGNGMFFDFKPWFLGGVVVLVLSLVFWVPLVLRMASDIRRLTHATQRIARGEFQISVPARTSDELGSLGVSIQTMAGRLDQLISGQKRFLGDAAHELCAPLARLRTGLGILENRAVQNDASALKAIDAEAAELAGLIEDILEFSKSGNRSVQLEEIDLSAFVKDLLVREAGHLRMTIEMPNRLMVSADRSHLSKILRNVLRNCQRHAGENAQVSIVGSLKNSWVQLEILDDGPGVSAFDLPRLFEPFYRPDLSRSRQTGGSGLGLAIVHGSAVACGGEVTGEIAENGGFKMVIRLKQAYS